MARTLRGSSAYKQTIRETEDGRQIERRVFSQVTRDLETLPDTAFFGTDEKAKEILARNQKLWSVLMFDVMDKENGLPEAVKAGVISLALFVDKHTPEVLAGRKPVAPLIEINRNILAGLAGKAANDAPEVLPAGA
jgi:flagellar protein FlaF